MKIRFSVPGEPVGKGRPRFTKSGHTYTPQKTRDYEEFIRNCFYLQNGSMRFCENIPLNISIDACCAIPKNASKKKREAMINGQILPTKKPDVDNITKIVLDALNGVAYYDDKQIVAVRCVKFYGDEPYVAVKIWEAL